MSGSLSNTSFEEGEIAESTFKNIDGVGNEKNSKPSIVSAFKTSLQVDRERDIIEKSQRKPIIPLNSGRPLPPTLTTKPMKPQQRDIFPPFPAKERMYDPPSRSVSEWSAERGYEYDPRERDQEYWDSSYVRSVDYQVDYDSHIPGRQRAYPPPPPPFPRTGSNGILPSDRWISSTDPYAVGYHNNPDFQPSNYYSSRQDYYMSHPQVPPQYPPSIIVPSAPPPRIIDRTSELPKDRSSSNNPPLPSQPKPPVKPPPPIVPSDIPVEYKGPPLPPKKSLPKLGGLSRNEILSLPVPIRRSYSDGVIPSSTEIASTAPAQINQLQASFISGLKNEADSSMKKEVNTSSTGISKQTSHLTTEKDKEKNSSKLKINNSNTNNLLSVESKKPFNHLSSTSNSAMKVEKPSMSLLDTLTKYVSIEGINPMVQIPSSSKSSFTQSNTVLEFEKPAVRISEISETKNDADSALSLLLKAAPVARSTSLDSSFLVTDNAIDTPIKRPRAAWGQGLIKRVSSIASSTPQSNSSAVDAIPMENNGESEPQNDNSMTDNCKLDGSKESKTNSTKASDLIMKSANEQDKELLVAMDVKPISSPINQSKLNNTIKVATAIVPRHIKVQKFDSLLKVAKNDPIKKQQNSLKKSGAVLTLADNYDIFNYRNEIQSKQEKSFSPKEQNNSSITQTDNNKTQKNKSSVSPREKLIHKSGVKYVDSSALLTALMDDDEQNFDNSTILSSLVDDNKHNEIKTENFEKITTEISNIIDNNNNNINEEEEEEEEFTFRLKSEVTKPVSSKNNVIQKRKKSSLLPADTLLTMIGKISDDADALNGSDDNGQNDDFMDGLSVEEDDSNSNQAEIKRKEALQLFLDNLKQKKLKEKGRKLAATREALKKPTVMKGENGEEIVVRKKRGRPFSVNKNPDADADEVHKLRENDEKKTVDARNNINNGLPPIRAGRGKGRHSSATKALLRQKEAEERSAKMRKFSEEQLLSNKSLLGNVFQNESDIRRAAGIILLMHGIQKSANVSSSLPSSSLDSSVDINLEFASTKLLLPSTCEINNAIDIFDSSVDHYYDCLKMIREQQYKDEAYLRDNYPNIKNDVDKESNSILSILASYGNDNIPKMNSSSSTAPTLFQKASSSLSKSMEPLLTSIKSNNKLRIAEAHFFATMICHQTIQQPKSIQSQQLNPNNSDPQRCKSSTEATSSSGASMIKPFNISTSNNKHSMKSTLSLSRQSSVDTSQSPVKQLVINNNNNNSPWNVASQLPNTSPAPQIPSIIQAIDEIVESHNGLSKVLVPVEPMKLDSFQRNSKQMAVIRPAIASAIRIRKVQTRKAWEDLGDQYLSVHHKWTAHIEDIEREEELLALKEGPKLRGSASNLRSSAMYNSNSIDTLPRVGRPSINFATDATKGALNNYSMSAVRSDYEQDRLIQQIVAIETKESKIQKGLCTIPDMLSPWLQADLVKTSIAPKWPEELREFIEENIYNSDSNNNNTNNNNNISFRNIVQDSMIDHNLSRLTVDGKRQLCGNFPLHQPCPENCNCVFQLDRLSKCERIWSDMEKAIFVDKFLQYPKNFHKIASFLSNRTTKDCIKFYYDSKSTIEFKNLLKEFDNRRKAIKSPWGYTLMASHMIGLNVYPPIDQKEPLIELPLDDMTYSSFLNQPPNMLRLFDIPIPKSNHVSNILDKDNKINILQPYPKQSTIIQAKRKAVVRHFSDHQIQNKRNGREGRGRRASIEQSECDVTKKLIRNPLGKNYFYQFGSNRKDFDDSIYYYNSNENNSKKRTFYREGPSDTIEMVTSNYYRNLVSLNDLSNKEIKSFQNHNQLHTGHTHTGQILQIGSQISSKQLIYDHQNNIPRDTSSNSLNLLNSNTKQTLVSSNKQGSSIGNSAGATHSINMHVHTGSGRGPYGPRGGRGGGRVNRRNRKSEEELKLKLNEKHDITSSGVTLSTLSHQQTKKLKVDHDTSSNKPISGNDTQRSATPTNTFNMNTSNNLNSNGSNGSSHKNNTLKTTPSVVSVPYANKHIEDEEDEEEEDIVDSVLKVMRNAERNLGVFHDSDEEEDEMEDDHFQKVTEDGSDNNPHVMIMSSLVSNDPSPGPGEHIPSVSDKLDSSDILNVIINKNESDKLVNDNHNNHNAQHAMKSNHLSKIISNHTQIHNNNLNNDAEASISVSNIEVDESIPSTVTALMRFYETR
eukprot:gene7980-10821_t